jgi:hypothetical protein|nr:MAG TPA: Microsomal signal peptidase 25 kDa subunit (SPC25) [Caudoviricetes sp.]
MEEKIDKLISIMDKFMEIGDNILHPIEFLQEVGYNLLVAIQDYSFNICLVAGFIALILYVFGYDKGKRWAFVIPCIYLILNIIIGVITNA